MDAELLKIRPHINSKLENQRQPALLLAAIEETIKEQSESPSAVSYHSLLLSTLDEAVTNKKLDIAASALYLEAIVVKFVNKNILHNQYQILESLLNLLATYNSNTPALKSLLVVLEEYYTALDNQQLQLQSFKSSFNDLLQLTIDNRPKVRKLAQSTVINILTIDHPYLNSTTNWVIKSFDQLVKRNTPTEAGIHLCALVQALDSIWPIQTLPKLATSLLNTPHLGNSYLTSSSYHLLSHLLSNKQSHTTFEEDKLKSLVETIATSFPKPDDVLLLSPWLAILDAAISSYARHDPEAASLLILNVWPKVYGDYGLASTHTDVRKSAEKALCGIIRWGVTTDMIKNTVEKNGRVNLQPILDNILSSLTGIAHRQALPNVITVLVAMISKLRVRFNTPGSTAAEALVAPHLTTVAELRQMPNFEFREKTDDVFGMALEVCGPSWVLSLLPLNLDPSKQAKGKDGRAYLLPIMRSRVSNTQLNFFVKELVPLSSSMFDASSKAQEQGKALEAKLYSTLMEQLWATFPAFCDLPIDLRDALTGDFAGMLSNVLYSQPVLRPSVLRGLRNLVEKNLTLCRSAGPVDEIRKTFNGLDQNEAKLNVEYLTTIAANLLSVLFDLFGTVNRDSRGMIGEVIADYLVIASEKDVSGTYKKLSKMLLETLPQHNVKMAKQAKSNKTFNSSADNTVAPHTTMDLLILLAPRLATKQAINAWEMGTSDQVLMSEDQAVQKKAYRLLNRLCESQKELFGDQKRIEKAISILTNTDNISGGVKRDRLELFSVLVKFIPTDKLHYIVSLVPEAVLGVKETNERARSAAFELLLALGRRMETGGKVERAKVGQDDDDDDEEMQTEMEVVDANINEYFTILSAGLAGSTPHFISATITSLARVLFEFRESIDKGLVDSLLGTLHIFVGSTNKEIVKAAIGLVKVTTTSLPSDIVFTHLESLIPSLLGWKNEHKNHFKVNVRHILERLVKKFGFENVEKFVPEADKKLITNIRKRTQRAKKGRAGKEDPIDPLDEDDDEKKTAKKGNDAFEDALYGSESEIEASDNEEENTKKGTSKRGKKQQEDTYIREDEGELVDLLDKSVVGRLSTYDPSKVKRKLPGQDAQKYKTDDVTGKLIIEDEDVAIDQNQDEGDKLAGEAYLENLEGEDGITMGKDGRVRFNKKRDRGQDVEMQEAGAGSDDDNSSKKKKKNRQGTVGVGKEFKSKRAGGDVTAKGGQQPYAYVPLNQTKKLNRGGQAPRLDVTGKKKGRSGKK
ncbi:NUC173-domain-containing protein [Wallemia mellicola]|uniref:NUC173-domain-containing protein n=1 Tax=Wallemia mellicola TaxID=1708541 RepID=A0A4T0R006_9BASI|nr:hypothetical protein E3Q23_02230 [Wallemia mellicola]TIB78381.1 NUC173-domain-containing protein [Wallemia mellicola]TIB97697.1 NUC173-domain-containing protein [Wallemia mellicola]TIC00013.1 NUC173-domain-containing protein [Wallemia mellicola]TIC11189.1 NUC173-domain-containing protein [Wallemia mellicola]